MMCIILMTSYIVTDLATNIVVHYCIDPLLDYLSKFDYFHIQMDFVILCGSTEWKMNEWMTCEGSMSVNEVLKNERHKSIPT
jgi:hypothetical protein